MNPIVSIILPVFNAEKYLHEAIDSILVQTLTDFELVIINDGSVDNSEKIVKSLIDERIVYVSNETNKGLIYTLNKGIQLAKGKFIARMDADDICLPNRLQKQVNWLETNPKTSVVGCHITFINETGETRGCWKEDLQTVTYHDIKNKMTWESCIAHPTVVMRATIAKQYKYSIDQPHMEDYDLWLRLLADGHRIEKVPEKLLLYRVHKQSVTGNILRKTNPFFKKYQCKKKFLSRRISSAPWGIFESKVLFTAALDAVMGVGKNLKLFVKS